MVDMEQEKFKLFKYKNRTAFFLRAYNDLDHFAPLIAEYLKNKNSPVLVVLGDLGLEDDYRFQYLSTLGGLEVFYDVDTLYQDSSSASGVLGLLRKRLYGLRRNPHGFVGKLWRKFFFNNSKEHEFLVSKNIISCVFEWSTPFARGDKKEQYFFAAKALGITTYAIPHGCNIFVNSDVTKGYRKLGRRGVVPDQSDTQLFDQYVFQNTWRRDGWIKWGFSPTKSVAWGSLRFEEKWQRKNLEICPPFNCPVDVADRLKVVFMQFQKEYNVHNELTFETLKQLSQIPEIALVVKDATREGKAFFDRGVASKELGSACVGWFGNEVHSPALVAWADCVVVVGGSIGIEVIMQGKPLIYPRHLNSNTTLYEELDAALIADSYDELVTFLTDLHNGEKRDAPKGEGRLLSEIIYAGKSPYDVAEFYYDRIYRGELVYGD